MIVVFNLAAELKMPGEEGRAEENLCNKAEGVVINRRCFCSLAEASLDSVHRRGITQQPEVYPKVSPAAVSDR